MTADDCRVSALALAGAPIQPTTPAYRLRRRLASGSRVAATLGADVDGEALEDTSRRVADAYVSCPRRTSWLHQTATSVTVEPATGCYARSADEPAPGDQRRSPRVRPPA